MKTKIKYIALTLLIGFSIGCFDDNDDTVSSSSSIKDFVWKAMNRVYLYNADVPDLADDRFSNNNNYNSYLEGFSSPENLFENLVYDRENVDRFSIITDNYFELEQSLGGISKRSGAEFNFYYVPGSTSNVFGIVRLILPNSNASQTSLSRGQIFNKINGTALTASNFRSLLSGDSYTIHIANYNDNNTEVTSDDTITDTTEEVTLIKSIYTENPIFKTEIFEVNNEKVGYLMYNVFVGEFDSELNQAFGTFKTENIDHLILDLRYNPGGSVRTATALGSMITGNFNNQVFATLKYNEDLQNNNYDYVFTDELQSGATINSLNLDKVYVLTSGASASASEMIINSLKSYITVVQIGSTTVGKSQASQIIYDSSNFGRANANPTHTYALLPLIAITVNKNNTSVPPSGLVPDIELTEKAANYGVLGDPTEPLLEAALNEIQVLGKFSSFKTNDNDHNFVILNTLDSKNAIMIAD